MKLNRLMASRLWRRVFGTIIILLVLLYLGKLPLSSSATNNSFEKTKSFERDGSVRSEVEALLKYMAFVKNTSRAQGQVLESSGYNEVYYDMLPLIRTIPDNRPDWCSTQSYHIEPISISVVFHYYNEPLSLVLRTIYSVLQTPSVFLHEIIVLDDGSDLNRYSAETQYPG